MSRIVKNTLLHYIPNNFVVEAKVNPDRIYSYNNKKIIGEVVVYLIERELRLEDNFAIQFAKNLAIKRGLNLKIIHPLKLYEQQSKNNFIEKQLIFMQKQFIDSGFDFELIEKSEYELLNYLKFIKTAVLIIDFNPICDRKYLNIAPFKIYEIDGHNILPARIISRKQEYSALTIRYKIYNNIYQYLTEYDNKYKSLKNDAQIILGEFIRKKLPYYAKYKNLPDKNVLSGLSKYMNWGFISSQRVALETIKSDVADINKEVFLEELIIRKELSDNFCLYCSDFKSLNGIPNWAKFSLNEHKQDLRVYIYDLDILEKALTHDDLWNATQIQLVTDGVIHGYLRMYWAKKILEWTESPEQALEYAIYLNDKYAFDSPSSNGYVGILWAIGGLHDKPFCDFNITGKIRRMTYNSIKNKFNIDDYIKKYL